MSKKINGRGWRSFLKKLEEGKIDTSKPTAFVNVFYGDKRYLAYRLSRDGNLMLNDDEPYSAKRAIGCRIWSVVYKRKYLE